jgi:hypothetical protein
MFELIVFLFPVVAALLIAGVISGVKYAALVRRRKLLVDEGDVGAWFEAAGLEPAPTPEGEVGARATALDGALTVALDVGSFADFGWRSSITVTLDLGDALEAGVTFARTDWVYNNNMHMSLGVDINAFSPLEVAGELFVFEGPERASLQVHAARLPEALLDAYLTTQVEGVEVSLERGVLTVVFASRAVEAVARDPAWFGGWVASLGEARARLGGGDFGDQLVSLVTRHGSASAPLTPRQLGSDVRFARLVWAAAEVLCAEHARDEAVRQLDAQLEHHAGLTRAACLRWGGEDGPFRRPAAERVAALSLVAEDSFVGEDARGVLTRELAWHALLEPSLPTFVRMDAAPRAFRSPDAPEDARARDAALAEVFTSPECARALALAIVFDQLTAAGWRPGPEAARRIATEGDRAGREKIMEFIQGRPEKIAYAGALAALKEAKVSGAAALFDRLDLSAAGGKLSLAADDASMGGLSQAGERGGLSAAED